MEALQGRRNERGPSSLQHTPVHSASPGVSSFQSASGERILNKETNWQSGLKWIEKGGRLKIEEDSKLKVCIRQKGRFQGEEGGQPNILIVYDPNYSENERC